VGPPASGASIEIPLTEVLKLALEANCGDERRNKKDVKDLWGPFAVVSVFIASVSIGLLSYSHDNFIERPAGTQAPTSDSVITSFFFVAVIFSGVAAMEFTALSLSSTASASSREVDTKDNGIFWTQSVVAASPTALTPVIYLDVDLEKGGTSGPISKKQRRKQKFMKLTKYTKMTSVVLLTLSCATLFAGIITFVWANQPRGVAIAVTVAFGLWCASPLHYVAIFLASVI